MDAINSQPEPQIPPLNEASLTPDFNEALRLLQQDPSKEKIKDGQLGQFAEIVASQLPERWIEVSNSLGRMPKISQNSLMRSICGRAGKLPAPEILRDCLRMAERISLHVRADLIASVARIGQIDYAREQWHAMLLNYADNIAKRGELQNVSLENRRQLLNLMPKEFDIRLMTGISRLILDWLTSKGQTGLKKSHESARAIEPLLATLPWEMLGEDLLIKFWNQWGKIDQAIRRQLLSEKSWKNKVEQLLEMGQRRGWNTSFLIVIRAELANNLSLQAEEVTANDPSIAQVEAQLSEPATQNNGDKQLPHESEAASDSEPVNPAPSQADRSSCINKDTQLESGPENVQSIDTVAKALHELIRRGRSVFEEQEKIEHDLNGLLHHQAQTYADLQLEYKKISELLLEERRASAALDSRIGELESLIGDLNRKLSSKDEELAGQQHQTEEANHHHQVEIERLREVFHEQAEQLRLEVKREIQGQIGQAIHRLLRSHLNNIQSFSQDPRQLEEISHLRDALEDLVRVPGTIEPVS